VTAAASAFSLACGTSGAHALVVSGGPTTYALDPDGTFARGETCTLTVAAGGVRDLDGDDPPDTMAADGRITFTTLGLELRIREIQGTQHVSPHLDDLVSKVPGVVTARRGNGFFFQDAEPDSDVDTSEGLFVFTGGAPRTDITVGSAVLVSGRVAEFRGAANALGMTQIVQPAVAVDGDGADIAPTTIGAGGRVPPGRIIDNDSLGDVDLNSLFDPEEDGIDFYESLEGMLVHVEDPYVVGPTASFGEIPVVADGGRFAGPFTARGGLIIEPDDFNPERMHFDDEVLRAQSQRMPLADVRDRLTEVDAVVDYSFGNFKLQVTSPPAVIDGGLAKEVTEPPGRQELSVGSFNVENLTPRGANPSPAQRAKYEALATTLVERMQAPDIVAVEEVQDNNGTAGGTDDPVTDASQTWQDLIVAIEDAGGPTYDYRQIDPVAHQDGGQPGGNIRVGFLFRTDRGLEFVDRPGGTSTNATAVADTRHGPRLTLSPGRIEPDDPAWIASRKPLAGEFRWRGRTVFAVANHFASKGGDDPLFGHFQPPVRHTEIGPDGRHRQAEVVNEFVRDVLDADHQARVIVLGDINDFEFSETVDILESGGALTSLFALLPKEERYSYVFEGNSQVLDQVLVSPSLMHPVPEYDSVHMNAEFADQTSDHDPQVARLHVTDRNDAAHAFGDR
jgi:predicted extracellular nuclease